jgi:hypothetical protein
MAALSRAVVGVALTPGLSHRGDLESVADHWTVLA